MQLMDDSLAGLYRAGAISAEETVSRSEDKQTMKHVCGMI
jgi:Tfp pilus assembly pilus retraction ATPase PilT